MKKYFLSFIEEAIFNPKYEGYRGGRLEVYVNDEPYAIEEIRFFTKNVEEFIEFRDKWDFQEVPARKLKEIRQAIKEKFSEFE